MITLNTSLNQDNSINGYVRIKSRESAFFGSQNVSMDMLASPVNNCDSSQNNIIGDLSFAAVKNNQNNQNVKS